MDADRIYMEIFETHYKDIKKHLEVKNYSAARQSTILAAKSMYELARNSQGKTREERIHQADELYKQIFVIDKIIDSENARKKAKNGQTSSMMDKKGSPEQHIMKNGIGSAKDSEDDQHVFEALPVPDISFDDVVGLYDVKEAVNNKIIEPRKHPELYEKYKISTGGGILMYGPPGTGKTMIAKAIAHEVNAEFFSLRCSDLVSKYFGGTEQNLSHLFKTARSKENAVIFFDEFEALAVGRDKNNSTVMRRVVTELLTQMQGIHDDNNKNGASLLVLAATNIPWLIDSAFMRPGRFDERIYVGLPDSDARRGILERNLNGIPCKESLDLETLVEYTNGFNCADIVQLVTKAKTYPLIREKNGEDSAGLLMSDFDQALETCHSSVMKSDIEKMIKWREANGEI